MRPSSCCFIVVASLVLSGTGRGADPRSDVIERTFTAAPGGKLVIDADRGSLTIEGVEGNTVRVEVARRVVRGSDSRAAALLERHHVEFTESKGEIRVEAKLDGENRWNWRGPQLQVEIRVMVPREFNIDAQTAGGSVHASRVQGTLALKTSGGSLQLEGLAGKVQGKTSGGSIKASGLAGKVELATSGGSIQISDVSGEELKVNTSGGSIHLDGIDVPVDARTSGGSIEVESSATPLRASTSGGSVSATLRAAPKSEVNLRTSAGGVTLSLPGNAAFDLDAATSAGGVHSEFPITVTDSREHSSLRGPVNGGGAKIVLRTSAGGIRIKKS